MKKKIFLVSLIILAGFTTILLISSLSAKKPPVNLKPAEAEKQSQDDLNFAKSLDTLHQKFPWYSQIPILTDNYTIAFNFEKASFRIILLKPATEDLKQSALKSLENIGVDLNQYQYYFIDPYASPSSFQQLLP